MVLANTKSGPTDQTGKVRGRARILKKILVS